ncbi:MAG: alpha/beta hydrolase [Dehalococcoidales bacterium]|nr:alpha/beta hydrolase [Dehalococcoidales bacterium]
MKKLVLKRGKKMLVIIGYVLGIIFFLGLIGFAVNKLCFSNELETVSPYGQMVEVNGHKMHVYSMGDSEKTVVLLPGIGISLPSADFGPLMRELSKDYTVVCIEYFGIGFSEQIDTPRTNINYTQEIRTALSLAGFKAPYILMPHSASGVYCEYYAAKYPNEISAIIMLDTTSTVKVEKGNPPKIVYRLAQLQQACGLTRITSNVIPPTQKVENGYTEKEIKDYKLFAYHVLNNTMINQSFQLLENINEVSAITFPQDIPVLKLISAQSVKKVGEEYQINHLKRIGENAELKIIDCSHFIYQTNVTDICNETTLFLNKFVSNTSKPD